jgi:DNA/RNA-binding domain of Phe-tRNA-synthetase-like protein
VGRMIYTPEVAKAFPEAEIRLLIAIGLDNSAQWPEASAIRLEVEAAAREGRLDSFDEESDYISTWHAAYRAFGTNPRRSRPSVEALMRRVRKSGTLPSISSAVDTYNGISVLSGLPAGAFDLDHITGDIHIRYGRPANQFEPLGEPGEWESVNVGEVVYADDETILTRHWNHRDCNKTMLMPSSRNAIFMLERVSGKIQVEELDSAASRLAGILASHSEQVHSHRLNRESAEAVLP